MKRIPNGTWGALFYALTLLVLFAILGFCLEAASALESARLPILMYHDVRRDVDQPNDYLMSTQALKRDFLALRRAGYHPVKLSEVISFVQDGTALPENPVLLVFDDGYSGFENEVWDLLKEFNYPALISVIGARAQGVWAGDAAPEDYLSWAALTRMGTDGLIERQSHSAYLHVYGARRGVSRLPCETRAQYRAMFSQDIRAMQKMSEDAGVPLLKAFAYPYGFLDCEAERLLREEGFLATMTSEEHVNVLTRDPECLFLLGRFNRSGLMTTEAMLALLAR